MRISLLLMLCATLFLSACGFHLRGESRVADRFNPLFIENDELQPQQLTGLYKALTRSSAKLSESSQQANSLRVKLLPLTRRKIAGSNLTDVELVQLKMGVQFSVLAKSGEGFLLEQQELFQAVEIELDNANILGHEQIIERTRQRLQRQLLQSMISRLSH